VTGLERQHEAVSPAVELVLNDRLRHLGRRSWYSGVLVLCFVYCDFVVLFGSGWVDEREEGREAKVWRGVVPKKSAGGSPR
jgi:hypothetical protein